MALKSAKRMCRHRHINLVGNDETGLKRISCGDCGSPMTRRVMGSGYIYFPACERCGGEKTPGQSCRCFDNGGE